MLTAPTKPQVCAHCLRPVHLLQWAEGQSKCLKNAKSSSPNTTHHCCHSHCIITCRPHTPRHNLLVRALLQMQQVRIFLRPTSVQSHLVLHSFQPPHKASVLPSRVCTADSLCPPPVQPHVRPPEGAAQKKWRGCGDLGDMGMVVSPGWGSSSTVRGTCSTHTETTRRAAGIQHSCSVSSEAKEQQKTNSAAPFHMVAMLQPPQHE